MIRKLIRIVLQLVGLILLVYLGVFCYFTIGIAIERNSLSMLSGPPLNQLELLGPDAHIDSVFDWTYKAPLVIALPKHVDNCSASEAIKTAAKLELIAVDSLCNISAHESNTKFVARCRSPLNEDEFVCFKSAYLGNLNVSWRRKSFEEGAASLNTHTVLREVTPYFALDSRINKLATSDAYGRQLNGSYNQSSTELRNYVKQTNDKLKASNFSQIDNWLFSVPYVWNYAAEQWRLDFRFRPKPEDRFNVFQEKFQIIVSTQ